MSAAAAAAMNSSGFYFTLLSLLSVVTSNLYRQRDGQPNIVLETILVIHSAHWEILCKSKMARKSHQILSSQYSEF